MKDAREIRNWLPVPIHPAQRTTAGESSERDHSCKLIHSEDERKAHRNIPCTCAACGRTVSRKARQQRFCSSRCRKRAHRKKMVAEGRASPRRYPYSFRGTNLQRVASNYNDLASQNRQSTVLFTVPLNLLGGYRWPETSSLDSTTRKTILDAEIARLYDNGVDIRRWNEPREGAADLDSRKPC